MATDTGYFCDDGIQDQLKAYTGNIGASAIQTGKVRMFKNNVTVSHSTILANLTENTFPGYAAVTLTTSSFGAATVSGHVASAVAASAFTFTCTGGGSSEQAYGAYITDSGNTKLLACWNFSSGPYTLVNNGDAVSTTPTLTSQSLN